MMFGFRPRFWPTLIAAAMLPILLGLGTWQLHRRAWKTELLATIGERIHGPAVALPADAAPSEWRFRHVTVSGRFANDQAFHLYGRTMDGKAGIHLLVPLIREGAPPLLVDRGFVPFQDGSVLAPYATDASPVLVDGIVREPETAGWFMPANDPARNLWYAVDVAAMSRQTGLPLAPLYVAASAGLHDGWPAATGGTEGTGIRNEHLNYAIFWYSMALVLIVIYVASNRKTTR